MDKLELTREMLIFLVQPEAYVLKLEALEQQVLHVALPEVSRQAANQIAAGIIQAFSSRVIEIKALQRQAEAQESAVRTIA